MQYFLLFEQCLMETTVSSCSEIYILKNDVQIHTYSDPAGPNWFCQIWDLNPTQKANEATPSTLGRMQMFGSPKEIFFRNNSHLRTDNRTQRTSTSSPASASSVNIPATKPHHRSASHTHCQEYKTKNTFSNVQIKRATDTDRKSDTIGLVWVSCVTASAYLSNQGHSSFITHLDWSKDGKYIMSNSGDYEILYCK